VRLDSILASIPIIVPRASSGPGLVAMRRLLAMVVFALRQIAYVRRRGDGGAAQTWLSIAGEVGFSYSAHGDLVMILHG
jgi:hypothetical protein